MQLQRDDIIIRKGIGHILDSHNGYLGLSKELLEMEPDFMEFVRGHIFRLMEGDDMKKCRFDGTVSPVRNLLEEMEEASDESFIEATRILAENLFDVMCDSVAIPAANLLCVSFQVYSVVYLALLKMNYKETKLTEAVIIDLLEYKALIMEKKYEMLNGDRINYLSERFLQCYAEMGRVQKSTVACTSIKNVPKSVSLKRKE